MPVETVCSSVIPQYFCVLPDLEPAYNLALEHWCFEHLSTFRPEGVLLFYRNKPSVIIGKNQNAFREVQWLLAESLSIPILRRMSGGGAVYHDPNNLNYSWIVQTGSPGNGTLEQTDCTHLQPDPFGPGLRWLQSVLADWGLCVSRRGESDLTWQEHKISGNAQARRNNRLLQHGTLLYDCSVGRMQALLHHAIDGFSESGVNSRRSSIIPLRAGLPQFSSAEACMQGLEQACLAQGLQRMEIPEDGIRFAREEAQTRYENWNWNFGKSPQCTWNLELDAGTLQLEIHKGVIRSAHLQTIQESRENLHLDHLIDQPLCGAVLIPFLKKNAPNLLQQILGKEQNGIAPLP